MALHVAMAPMSPDGFAAQRGYEAARMPGYFCSKPASIRPSASCKSIPMEPVTIPREPRLLQAVHVPAPPWTLQAPAPVRWSDPPRHASPSPARQSPVRQSPVRPSWAPSSARLRAELTEPAEPTESAEPRPATPSSLWPEGGGRIRLPCKALEAKSSPERPKVEVPEERTPEGVKTRRPPQRPVKARHELRQHINARIRPRSNSRGLWATRGPSRWDFIKLDVRAPCVDVVSWALGTLFLGKSA
ncbi:unnamed protein product [Symbiodinium necroappetens]|uniref:Uncharacterized protein n=1 Tax=Symbiodinium necroappetens TaxID=1628268 RepID=A0A812WZN9_9DINO|nr:unnamed protein product [Symbiodinium necroappetens]